MDKEQFQKSSPIEFRREALENFSISDRTDQLIQVTTPKSWILLAGLGALILATIIWGFWGSITIWVEGQGMLLPEKGSIHNAEAPIGPGQILEIKVQPQDKVRKDDIVAILETPNLTKQVEVTRAYLADLKKNYDEQNETATKEIAGRKETLEKQNGATQRILASERENLAETEKLLKARKELLEKKMTTNQLYHDSLNHYYDTKTQIERAQEQLLQNQLDVENFIDRWEERLKTLDAKIKDEQLNLDTLEEKLKLSKYVKSPVDGVVISVSKTVGEIVQEGDDVVNIAKTGEGVHAVIYLAPKDGKNVKIGQEALVTPANIKKEEYGSIKGKVTYVSSFPVSEQNILAVLQNENLVKEFSKEGSPISIWVKLERDSGTFSKLKWSSSAGPEQEVTPGSLMLARVIVREQSPFSLVIPSLRKALEP